jgi:endonuclease/exonuclease/phosphatase family metal-dependent hydrolase
MIESLKEAMRSRRLWMLASAIILLIGFTVAFFCSHRIVRHQEPHFLSFKELQKLSENDHPGGLLERKLERFWKTPMIDNEAYYRGSKPHRPKDPNLGDYLRVASWNIEKSYHIKEAMTAFSSENDFKILIDPSKAPEGSPLYKELLRQRKRLSAADIIVLQEMDIGNKRSGYINAAAEIAKKLDMNYAYGAEDLEVDPVYLGSEKIYYHDGSVDQEAMDYYAADPRRYKGVFGCAVLSRYPIKHVEVFQLKTKAYDWYRGEKSKTGFLEHAREVGARILFKNEHMREVKVGGRIYFRVDLEVAGLPEETLTMINVHLEIKCMPAKREAQMSEILFSYIQKIKHPVILMGDFNSAPQDLSSTSVSRAVEGIPEDIAALFSNPVKPLFTMIRDYRFDDGGAFDFRGDKNRSINGKDQELANSNQRDLIGFKTTFSVKRPLAKTIGKYRLDWVFVKSYLKDPFEKGPYRLAPHFGETLEELNTSLKTPISDHHPNVVDLPFEEPKLS